MIFLVCVLHLNFGDCSTHAAVQGPNQVSILQVTHIEDRLSDWLLLVSTTLNVSLNGPNNKYYQEGARSNCVVQTGRVQS